VSSFAASHFRLRSVVAASVTVCLAVVATISAPSPSSGVAGFGDVPESVFYTEAVQWMVDNGITTGTSPECFSPLDPVTRGQAAAFMWRMEGEPGAPSHPFEDTYLPWQQGPVSWMFAENITTGTSSTTFSPDDVLTRGQLAALLWRLAGEPAASAHSFKDVTASWQQGPVAWMASTTPVITTGTSPTTFSPNEPVTRGQLATFFWRYKGSPDVSVDRTTPVNSGCAQQVPGPTTTTTVPPTTTTTTPLGEPAYWVAYQASATGGRYHAIFAREFSERANLKFHTFVMNTAVRIDIKWSPDGTRAAWDHYFAGWSKVGWGDRAVPELEMLVGSNAIYGTSIGAMVWTLDSNSLLVGLMGGEGICRLTGLTAPCERIPTTFVDSSFGLFVNDMSLSPDGQTLAVLGEFCCPTPDGDVAGDNLFFVPLDGSPLREIAGPDFYGFSDPAWMPDGSQLLIPVKVGGTDRKEIFRFDVGTGTGTRLTYSTFDLAHPKLSADGTVATVRDQNTGSVFQLNLNVGSLDLIVNSPGSWNTYDLSPDGRVVVYSRWDGNDYELWMSPVDGGPARQLTDNDHDDRNPRFSPVVTTYR